MTRILARWVQLSALATALMLTVYVTAQQVLRQIANDPQIQLARDASAALAAGAPSESVLPATRIDISTSLSPWVQVRNDTGRLVASSMQLHGETASVPDGVLDNARAGGEQRVTWQPGPGVRMATVTVRVPGSPTRYVTAGRSLAESEDRTGKLGGLLTLLWVATLVGLFVAVWLTETFFAARP